MSHHRRFRPARPGLALLLTAIGLLSALSARPASGDGPARGKIRPAVNLLARENRIDFSGGTDWINVGGPIHGEDLRGKIVLLDFWTFCCINCHHVLPDLAYLEEKYKNEIVVIGVHTPKFTTEKDTENLRKKVAEYRIKHPVVNDANQVIWNRYGVESWPTLGVFDVDGSIVKGFSGEGHRAELDTLIGSLVKKAKAAKTLDSRPLITRPESAKEHNTALKYPGKIFADAAGKRLFISDTGHNRIVVTNLSGKHIETIGTGHEGRTDGAFDKATFNRPQGLTLLHDTLYVADTESHAIRAVDLKAKTVTTIAGNGTQASHTSRGGPGKSTELTSPWDVVPISGGKALAIAMAGSHQIWKLDLGRDEVTVWAGNGRENIVDGTLTSSSFAQPSGLATDGKHLFVADSEVSGVRSISLEGSTRGRVASILGVGLFAFGDIDGHGIEARLQHCLGVTYGDGKLYIADTYNNKVKVCDPATRLVKTLAGNREAGKSDDPAQFDEPGGLSLIGSTLYVADTNNHAIRAVNVKTGATKTLALEGVTAPPEPKSTPKFPKATLAAVPETKLAPGREIAIDVTLSVPVGFKLNTDSPLVYLVESTTPLDEGVSPAGTKIDPPTERFTIKVPLARPAEAGETVELKLSLSEFICKKGSSGYCTVSNFIWTVPVTFAEDGVKSVAISNVKAD